MSKQRFTNNAESTLAAGIGPGATSFSVASGHGARFPSLSAGQYFYVRLGTDSSNEVVKITARSTDAFTCDATAGAWSTNDSVKLTVSAQTLEAFAQAVGGGQVLNDHELKDYSETVTTPAISSNTLTLNIENGNVFSIAHNANITTLTISNPSATGKSCSFTLILKQDSGGGKTITWPAAVKWAGGAAPTLTTTANAVNILTFITIDAGTTWYGMLGGAGFA